MRALLAIAATAALSAIVASAAEDAANLSLKLSQLDDEIDQLTVQLGRRLAERRATSSSLGELTISPLILPWWYQIPTQCKRPKVLLVHALPRGHLSSSPDALLPILSSRPPQLCQLRHARLLPPPTGDSIQTLRLRWPCPQTLRAAERVDVQRSARALNRSPHYAEPCRLRPLVRLAFDPLTVMWFPPAGRWR